MRGRRPSGPEFVEHLPGSQTAKERARVVLETIAGTMRVQEACQRLGISEPRFDQLRIEMLLGGIERLEARPAGRPAQSLSPEEQRIRELEAKLAQAELKLKIAQTREEIVLALPRVVSEPQKRVAATRDPEKKTRHRHRRARARSPATRNT